MNTKIKVKWHGMPTRLQQVEVINKYSNRCRSAHKQQPVKQNLTALKMKMVETISFKFCFKAILPLLSRIFLCFQTLTKAIPSILLKIKHLWAAAGQPVDWLLEYTWNQPTGSGETRREKRYWINPVDRFCWRLLKVSTGSRLNQSTGLK